MKTQERSRALRDEADQILKMIELRKHCAPIGDVLLTGSYFMDVMMYPDIDLYLPPTSSDVLLSVAAKIADHECVKKLNFKKGGVEELEEGLYLKPYVDYGNWGRPWKVDMWCLPRGIAEKKHAELVELETRMTATQRERILNYKFQALTQEGRTPMFSGIYIYRAVIELGYEDSDDITMYLRENDIAI